MRGRCTECGDEITGKAWAEIVQYEQPHPTPGYRNHTALRRETGRKLCDGCLHREKTGVTKGQEALI